MRDGPVTTINRVVQIGFHRCGTRALTHLFARSGYRAAHWRIKREAGFLNLARMMRKNIAAGVPPFRGFEDYSFLSDLECWDEGLVWSGFKQFRVIDAAYPGTKFLLNTRNKDDWLQSRLTHRRYAQKTIAAHDLSGIADLLEFWSAEWDDHMHDVSVYFAERPDDLIRFDIDRDDIAHLVRQLPAFSLDQKAWRLVGRSQPEHVAANLAALKTFIAERDAARAAG